MAGGLSRAKSRLSKIESLYDPNRLVTIAELVMQTQNEIDGVDDGRSDLEGRLAMIIENSQKRNESQAATQ